MDGAHVSRFTFDAAATSLQSGRPTAAVSCSTRTARGPCDLYQKTPTGAGSEELLWASTMTRPQVGRPTADSCCINQFNSKTGLTCGCCRCTVWDAG